MSDSSEAFFKLLKWKDDKSFPIDFGGHCHGIEANEYGALDYYREHAMNAFAFRGDIDDIAKKDEAKIALANAIENKIPLAEPLTAHTCFCQCRHCGEELQFATDGTKIWVLNRCEYPEGHPAYEFEINIPSGHFVIGNDFRGAFPVAGDFDINTTAGMKATSDAYAKIGLAHAFVGNTCPGVYKIKDGSFVIGTCGSKGRSPVKRARRVAGVCTDLWWYSVADFDEYCLRYKIEDKKTFLKEKDHYIDIIKCRPGVYRFKHQYHLQKDDYKQSQVYTYVDWVREPDPVVDLQADYESKNYTAGQIISHYQQRWGYSIERAIDQLFFTNGSGTEIHPNGWLIPSSAITEDEVLQDVEIPVLDKQCYWYPFSDYSMICYAAGCAADHYHRFHGSEIPYLNESFTAVAFNALRCILLYGIDPKQKDWEKQMLDAARKAIKGLAKIYPDRVPENCKELLESLNHANI